MSRQFVATLGGHGSDASIVNRQPDECFYSLTRRHFLRLAELLKLFEEDPVYSKTRLLLRHHYHGKVNFALKQESRPTNTQDPALLGPAHNTNQGTVRI